jgi:ParB family chromosome partitioning protein
MAEEKKCPKTAVLAFLQDLENNSLEEEVAVKAPMMPIPLSRTEPLTESSFLPQRKFEPTQETQLYTLPSGKKSRFIPKTISSKNCRVWPGNSRIQEKLENTDLEELKGIILAQGQQVPVLARPLKFGENNISHEIIYGSRRLKVCQQLGIDLKIIEADISDEDALLLMEAENSGRQDISLYEKAKAYQKWIEEKRFDSYNDLAQKLGKGRRWVFKLISFLKIPSFLIEAIPNLNELTKLRAEKILTLISKNEDALEKLREVIKAIKLEKEDYSTDELFKKIFLAFQKKEDKSLEGMELKEICAADGENILTIKTARSGKIHLEINKQLSPQRLAKLLDGLEKVARKA